MSIFKNPLLELDEYNKFQNAIMKDKKIYEIIDLTDSSKAHIISEILNDTKKWKLVITYDEMKLRQLYEDISSFSDNVILYPSKDLLFFYADVEGHLISKERINTWKKLSKDEAGIVICTIDAIMDKLEDFDDFYNNILKINSKNKINLDELSKKLVDLGYERVNEVEGMGSFSIRGGIIDIYPLTEEMPIRIELWDDEIDSIRRFELYSQRSVENIDEVNIYPAKERDLLGKVSFLRYFDKDKTLIFIDELDKTYEKAKHIEDEFFESIEARINSGQIDKDEIPNLYSTQEIFELLSKRELVLLSLIKQSSNILTIDEVISINTRQVKSYKNTFETLIKDLKKLKKEKYRVVLFTASKSRAKRLALDLRQYDLLAFEADKKEDIELMPSEILVAYGNIQKGFEYINLKFCLISETDIYGAVKKNTKNSKRKFKGDNKILSLSELNIGDYIIHEEHGLGIYRGIEKIESDDCIKDYIKLEYADNANCYIPVTKLEIIQKYTYKEEKKLKLNKLASLEWNNTKNRVKKAVENIAKELLDLYAKRLNAKAYIYPKDTVWQSEFEEMFPFEETKDQLKAVEDIKNDMQSDKIMDRLICGDVGYGKTEVAMRAIFKAVQEGKQVIYLAPTTILARQHYKNFIERMKEFPVKIDLLCRFKTKSEQKLTIENFKKGLVDIVIGTHRVLSNDVVAKDLGLLVIDEEQRFGVKDKEKLKALRNSVDVLTLTATPIPRTLHMSLVGIRDLSILEEAPIDRLPIQTYVMEYYDETLREAIRREIARKGQVYYVYNAVKDIEEVAKKIKLLVPNARVEFAHGQMQKNKLENIMLEFIDGNIDVLVSTTIIETGLDIPNANTMIIQDADKFGLSQLYQLRGRVGRSSRTSYAFMLYKKGKLLKEEATKRLKAIREFTELGSGIRIAMRDLEIRGAGNVLGSRQHGHMEAVGYDLYCKLLNTAIKNLRGMDTVSDEFETTVESPIDAYIPETYICNEELKLEIYKKIVSISCVADYIDLQDEIIDRFGEYPKELENLLNIAKIKALAHKIYIEEVYINKDGIKLIFYKNADIAPDIILNMIKKYNLNIINNLKIELIYNNNKSDIKALFKLAEKILLEIYDNIKKNI